MASLPMMLSLADDMDRLAMSAAVPFYGGYDPALHYYRSPYLPIATRDHHPLRVAAHSGEHKSGAVSTIGKDGFQVCMDVGHFKPSELTVKVVDHSVVVEGRHEEREDNHGYIKRHFVRRYSLPKGYPADKVMSTLSSDGVLTVGVPKPMIEDASGERIVQIQQVGPAHLNVKENPKEALTDKQHSQEEGKKKEQQKK